MDPIKHLPAPDQRDFEVYPLFLQCLGLFVRHLPLFVGLNLPVVILSSLCLYLGAPTLADADPQTRHPFAIPPNEWLALAGSLLIVFSFGLWAAAAIYRAADDALAGSPVPGFRAAYSWAVERVPALLGAELLYILAVMVGTVFCFVPGIWLGVMLVPALPRAATRDVGPMTALRDARDLVAGRWWRVAGFGVLVAVTILAIYAPYSFLNVALPHGNPGALLVRALANVFAAALITPFQACAYTALHRRLEETA